MGLIQLEKDLPMSLLDCLSDRTDAADRPGAIMIDRILQFVRQHLGMEVAYVPEFVGNDSVYRPVDAPGLEALIKPGDSRSLDDVYCRHILAGHIAVSGRFFAAASRRRIISP